MTQRLSIVLLICMLCIAFGWNAWRATHGEHPATSQPIGGHFALTDSNGKPFESTQINNQYKLVYFGYSFCPDICPTELQRITELLQQLPEATTARITPIFISVDPARDTPQALTEYIHFFHPRFIALTGSEAQIDAVAKQFRAYYQRQSTSPTDRDYAVDHSSYIYLLDPQDRYISHFTRETPLTTMRDAIITTLGAAR